MDTTDEKELALEGYVGQEVRLAIYLRTGQINFKGILQRVGMSNTFFIANLDSDVQFNYHDVNVLPANWLTMDLSYVD